MKAYVFNKFSRVQRVLADEHEEGYLSWPNTRIPYLDQDKLGASPRRDEINRRLNEAETSEAACTQLWADAEILEMTLKAEDSV